MFQDLWYQMGRAIVSLYVRGVMKADIHLDGPFPKGAKIIAVNHPSTNDPAFVTALSREHMTILIKETVFKVPLFGRSLRMSGHVPVVAGHGRAALEEGIRQLRAGKTVMIFPEGEINLGSCFKKAHTGVARLALATGAPVIPVGISLDHQKVRVVHSMIDGEMEPSSWYLRGPYAMTVGKPVAFQGNLEDYDCVRGVTNQIMNEITALHRRGNLRLVAKQIQTRPIQARLPGAAFRVARKGTRLGLQQSIRLVTNTAAFRLAESILIFFMVFGRHITG